MENEEEEMILEDDPNDDGIMEAITEATQEAELEHIAEVAEENEVVEIESEWPILDILQLFQYFPTEVVQIDSEWPILDILQLFQYFPTKVVQVD